MVFLLVFAVVELKHLPLKLLVLLFCVDMLSLLEVDLCVELLLVELRSQSGFVEVLSRLGHRNLILSLHDCAPFVVNLYSSEQRFDILLSLFLMGRCLLIGDPVIVDMLSDWFSIADWKPSPLRVLPPSLREGTSGMTEAPPPKLAVSNLPSGR